MKIEVLASGSTGNVTAVLSGESLLLIDCGKSFRWTVERLNYRLPDAVILTHEHEDHSKAAKNFLERGVEIYMTQGTVEALELSGRHNLHTITAGENFTVCGIKFKAIESDHDAKEPVNFIFEDENDRVLFVTDTGTTPQVSGDFTKIFIEANYLTEGLMNSDLLYPLKMRIKNNHYSIEQAEKFVARYPRTEVTLLHISKRHGDGEEFYKRIRRAQNGNRYKIGGSHGSLPLYAARRLQQFSKI